MTKNIKKLKILLKTIETEVDHDSIDYEVKYCDDNNCIEIFFQSKNPIVKSEYFLQYSFDYNHIHIWNGLTEYYTKLKTKSLKPVIKLLYS